MATRAWLQDVLPVIEQQAGIAVQAESVGGVDAARRVRSGERFDLVFLACDALEALMAEGHLMAGTLTNVVRSDVALAVRASGVQPDISTEPALREAVIAAASIGYSTGPSGTQLLKLFERWGIRESLGSRLVQAPPGVPVAKLIADGAVALGFQQTSELIGSPGIQVIGPLPAACAITTIFSAAIATQAASPDAVDAARRLLQWLASDATAESKRARGLAPA